MGSWGREDSHGHGGTKTDLLEDALQVAVAGTDLF